MATKAKKRTSVKRPVQRKHTAVAKKRATSGKASAAARPSSGQAVKATREFRTRWRELTGDAFKSTASLPPGLIASIGTLRAGQAVMKGAPPLPAPPKLSIVLAARATKGAGCGKVAEIAGWYSMTFAPGFPVIIGPAAVKAVLDAEAAKVCGDKLQCPADKDCPCTYIPQPQLAKYEVGATFENGYLLQDNRVWNCQCGGVTG